jgi:hypothetical protein
MSKSNPQIPAAIALAGWVPSVLVSHFALPTWVKNHQTSVETLAGAISHNSFDWGESHGKSIVCN